MRVRWFVVMVVTVGLVGLWALSDPGGDSAASAPVSRLCGSIAMTPDSATIVVVNPDSNTVSVIDAETLELLAEIPVGIEPKAVAIDPLRSIVYVADYGSDTISVVDLATYERFDSIPVGDRPAGLAIAGDGTLLAVAEYGDDMLRLVDTTKRTTSTTILIGDRPYAAAFTPDGSTVVVSHLLSGAVTFVSVDTEKIETVGTWANVAPAPGVTINATGTRAYLPQTMAHGLGRNTQFDNTVFAKISVVDLIDRRHVTAEHISLPEKDQPVGLPWHVALAKEDNELWVVNGASNDVSILDIQDPNRPRRVAHVSVSYNPRGIVIDAARARAYVTNSLAGTVSVIDMPSYEVVDEVAVTEIPLPPILLAGKRLYHTSVPGTVAKAAWISCNTCHVEGEHDGRTWLLQFTGDVPDGADPVVRRNTTSLLGMIDTYPLRWSAEWDESADSEFSIRFEQFGTGLIDGEMHPTLGEPNQGRSYELDCLATYIDSLRLPQRQHTLTPAEARGKALFESDLTGCAICHPAPLYTDLKQHDVGTVIEGEGEWFGAAIDTPTLRFLYDSAPYFHDGSAATLREALTVPSPGGEHDVSGTLSESEIQALESFLLALPLGDEL